MTLWQVISLTLNSFFSNISFKFEYKNKKLNYTFATGAYIDFGEEERKKAEAEEAKKKAEEERKRAEEEAKRKAEEEKQKEEEEWEEGKNPDNWEDDDEW